MDNNKIKKAKNRVTNVTPFHAELEHNSKGFTLVFYANIGGDYSRRHLVKVHFDNSWVGYLASLLWKAVNKSQTTIDEQKKALRGGG